MPKTQSKTYSLRGKVIKVYEPREVVMSFGGKKVVKEVSDLYLQLETGPKVKVSFWDTDVSHHEGSVVVLSALVFKGKYKDTPQYSSTKETTISVAKKGTVAPAVEEPETTEETAEGAVLEDEPTFGEPGDDGCPPEEAPEGAAAEETEAPKPVAVKKIVAAKATVVAKPKVAAKATIAVYAVDPAAIAITLALAKAATLIVDAVAPELVKTDPQALQSLFATIFINLGLKDYSAHGGR